MRLIDADALIEKSGEWYTEEGTEEGFIGTVKQLLELQPEAVVRCKDCKHADHRRDEYGEFLVCEYDYYEIPLLKNADMYCSEGERRTDE